MSDADDGDIVAVIINNRVIVRRYFKENKLYRLQYESDTVESDVYEQIIILVKIIGLFRK